MDAVIWLIAGFVLLGLMAMTINYEFEATGTFDGKGDYSGS